MKNIRFSTALLCLFMLGSTAFAGVKVKWSAPLPEGQFLAKILGEDRNGVFALSSSKGDYSINGYDEKTLKPLASNLIVLADQANVKIELEDVFFMTDKIIAFASGFDKNSSQSVTYAFTFNTKTGKLSGKPVLISEIEVDNKRRQGNFGFVPSKNGKFMLVHHFAYSKKLEKQQLTFQVYDAELELVKEVTRDYELNDKGWPTSSVSNFTIDDEGNVFYFQNRSSENEDGGGSYLISHLFLEDYELRETLIEFEDNQGMGGKLGLTGFHIVAQNGSVYLAGYYLTKSGGLLKYLAISGTFYSKVDIATNEIVAQSVTKFDDDLKRDILTSRQMEKGREIPATFFVKDILVDKMGEMVIVSESYTVSVYESKGVQIITHTYGSLIVSKIGADGNTLWTRAVPKTQIYSEKRPVIGVGGAGAYAFISFPTSRDMTIYFSYVLGIGKDDVSIIYNENPKNFALPNDDLKSIANMKKAIPALITINDKGEMKKTSADAVLSAGVILRPKIHLQVSEDEVIVCSSLKKVNKIGRITFD